MSHYELWKKCSKELDNIIIVEDDVDINKKLKDDINFIQTSMLKNNSCVIMTLNIYGAYSFIYVAKGCVTN